MSISVSRADKFESREGRWGCYETTIRAVEWVRHSYLHDERPGSQYPLAQLKQKRRLTKQASEFMKRRYPLRSSTASTTGKATDGT